MSKKNLNKTPGCKTGVKRLLPPLPSMLLGSAVRSPIIARKEISTQGKFLLVSSRGMIIPRADMSKATTGSKPTAEVKALIEVTPDIRDRLKAIAARDRVPLKRAASAILKEQLPQFESGEAAFTSTETEIER